VPAACRAWLKATRIYENQQMLNSALDGSGEGQIFDLGLLCTWLYKEYFANALFRVFYHFVVTSSGPIVLRIVPLPWPVFPI